MRPTKKHQDKTITIYSEHFDETLTGIYNHIDKDTCFELTHEWEGITLTDLFSRSDFVVVTND